MPERDWNGWLSTSVHTVLETMFFAEPMGPVEPEPVALSPLLASRLSFRGEYSGGHTVENSEAGSFGLCVSMDAARQLAAGFLAEDEADLTDASIAQVVCEITNMLCGAVVSNLGRHQNFLLSSPELVPPEGLLAAPAGVHLVANAGVRQVARQCFTLETGSLTVFLDIVLDGDAVA